MRTTGGGRAGGNAAITGRVEFVEARGDKPICTVATSVNAAGERCLTGTARVYIMPLEDL